VGSQTAAFIGREHELSALLELGARVGLRGGPVAAFVLGDPGSGKSRLLGEASDRVRLRQQFRIVGFEPARQVPLAAASDLLRALTAAPWDGPRLRALLYEIPVTTGPVEPLRIFEAAHRALRALGPALIVADDLQWADERTLAICQYLMRAAHTLLQPVGLFVASRPSPNAVALLASLQQLLPPESLATLELDPLSRQDGIRLATQLAPELAAERAAEVWAQAKGSPFWIGALARAGDADSAAINLVSARLRGLGVDPTMLFTVLSVGGRQMGLADLAHLLSWEPSRVDGAAAQLINRGVVVQLGGMLALAHDLIREAAMRQLPLPERRRIHRQLAAWLEAEAGDDIGLLRLALEHRRGGGLSTADLALRLARAPNRCLLGADGLRELTTIADEAKPGVREALDLQREVASMALEMGDWSVALDRFARLSEEELTEPKDRARAAYGAATAALELRRGDVAQVYLAGCQNSDDPLLAIEAEALAAQAVGWIDNRLTEAKAHAARAADGAHRLVIAAGGVQALTTAERRATVAALRAAFDGALWGEDVVEMLRVSDELASAGRSLGDVSLRATMDASWCYWPLGRFREAEVRFRRVLAEARRRVLPGIIADASFWLATALRSLGRLAEARAHAMEAVELSNRGVLPARLCRTEVLGHLFEVAALHKNWKHELSGLAALLAAEPIPHSRMQRLVLVRWLARFGGVEVADQVARELSAVMNDVDAAGCERCRWDVTLGAIEAYARIGRCHDAHDLAARWDAHHRDAYPFPLFQRHHAEALLVAQSGDVLSAVPLFEAARIEAERMGALLDGLWVEIDLGEALGLTDPQRAIATLQGAANLAQAFGSENSQQRAERVLRSLGVRTWKRTTTFRGGPLPVLSAREHEIVRLVAEGASNPEIASSLFLSRRTVERHVSNLLHKLDVRNRTELASAITHTNGGAHS
jgi:DNA-binding CsgD family transcriptional regulator